MGLPEVSEIGELYRDIHKDDDSRLVAFHVCGWNYAVDPATGKTKKVPDSYDAPLNVNRRVFNGESEPFCVVLELDPETGVVTTIPGQRPWLLGLS